MTNLDFKNIDFKSTISTSDFQIEMSHVMFVVEEKTMLIQILRALVL